MTPDTGTYDGSTDYFGGITISTTSATGTVTSRLFFRSFPPSYSSNTPDRYGISDFIEKAMSAIELKRLRSRAARLAQVKLARRYPRRVKVRPRPVEPFARRTCSLSSRWMVIQ